MKKLLLISFIILVIFSSAFACQVTILADDEFFTSIMSSINNSEKDIKIATFVFLVRINKSNRAKKIADALINAHKRGIDVEVYLEASGKNPLTPDNLKSADYLKKAGIKVFVDSDNTKNHFKIAIIDGEKLYIGSHNITSSAMKYNKELSVLIESREKAQQCLSYLKSVKYDNYE